MNSMQRSFLLCLLLTAGLGSRALAQSAKFNFSATAAAVTGWTNVIGDPSKAVVTATSSGITVSSVATTNWVPYGGASAYNGVGESTGNATFPGGVLYNHWYQYGSQAEYNVTVPQLLISGLNPDSTYSVMMAGSSTSSLNANPVQYTCVGAVVYTSQLENNHNNTTAFASFNVTPNSSGQIKVYVNTQPTTDVADISGLIIGGGSVIPLPTDSITSPANGSVLGESGSVVITANAASSGGSITQVQFFNGTTLIGTSTTAPYSVTWTDPAPGSYTLTATATDFMSRTVSSSVRVTIEAQNYFWSTTGNISTNGDSSFVGTVDTNRLTFRTNDTLRMTITKQGTVMIGPKTPDSGNCKLKVIGTTWTAGFLMPTGAAAGYVLTSDGSGNGTWQPGGSGHWLFANGTVYDSLDNVAIGTSNPQGYKLAVNGSGIFTRIVAKPQASWPDYVFKPGYSLLTLPELEQYIRDHHHLPDVTEEAGILAHGIDLGAEQTTLLKKVEELTLYLIGENRSLTEQNKQLSDQAKQLSEQKTRLDAQQQEIDELKALIRADHKP